MSEPLQDSDFKPKKQGIIFYDGVCPLCHAWVKWVIQRDPKKRFLFAAIESQTGESYLSPEERKLKESVIYMDSTGEFYRESEAVLPVLSELSGGARVLALFGRLFPVVFRNLVYRGIARSRYRIFGKYDTCPLPPPEWRDRFLS